MYTDGITEATNLTNELFGEIRLLECVNNNKHLSIKKIIQSVKNDIDIFADGAVQADDITMLGLVIQ